jgi:outer membrane autotransporter protein
LQIGDQSENSLFSQVGARASYAWKFGGTVVTPEVRAQWGHEFQDSSRSIGSTFAQDPTASFNVRGPQVGRDSLIMDVGVTVRLNPRTSFFAYYTGDFGAANYALHSVNGGVRIDF